PDLPSGSFVGPDGLFGGRGHPHVVSAAAKAYDREAWTRLWEMSEQLTGVTYEFAAPAPA
ncbi:MAG: short-chain dehydrogenase, partial [Solirubrobacteraceae bacterium]